MFYAVIMKTFVSIHSQNYKTLQKFQCNTTFGVSSTSHAMPLGKRMLACWFNAFSSNTRYDRCMNNEPYRRVEDKDLELNWKRFWVITFYATSLKNVNKNMDINHVVKIISLITIEFYSIVYVYLIMKTNQSWNPTFHWQFSSLKANRISIKKYSSVTICVLNWRKIDSVLFGRKYCKCLCSFHSHWVLNNINQGEPPFSYTVSQIQWFSSIASFFSSPEEYERETMKANEKRWPQVVAQRKIKPITSFRSQIMKNKMICDQQYTRLGGRRDEESRENIAVVVRYKGWKENRRKYWGRRTLMTVVTEQSSYKHLRLPLCFFLFSTIFPVTIHRIST